MKIAHVADCHWGLNYPGPNPAARFEDITRTMDWVADRIIEEGCELVLFAGDAFKDARVFIDRATIEIAAFTRWLRRLSDKGIQTVVISGTPSHDAVSAYRLIAEMKIPYVEVFTEPGIAQWNAFSVCCLPGLNRSNFATEDDLRGLPPHEIHQRMTDWITETAKSLRSSVKSDGPAFLLSHLTYDLADTGFEDALLQNEPILTDEASKLFDFVALGHIHRPQKAGSNVFYSGAPERHSFGDEKTIPGFYIHEFNTVIGTSHSRFVETPARRFKTIRWTEFEVLAWLDNQLDKFDVADAMVRVQYNCGENTQKRFDRRALEIALYDAGAYYVHEIKADVERTDRSRDAEVTEAIGPLSALAKWSDQQGIETKEAQALQIMTAALLEEVSV